MKTTRFISRRNTAATSARFWLVVGILAACALLGGSARGDVITLLALRPLLVLTIAATLLLPGRPPIPPALRWPIAMLGLLGIVIALQLVPLPPALWIALPGHSAIAKAADTVRMAQPWRPISISPDLTDESLVALCVPLAVLLGYAALNREQQLALVAWVIGIACVSAVLGILQMIGGRDGNLYIYAGVNEGLPSGLLANRNHQALLLSMSLPMLAWWGGRSRGSRGRGWIAIVAAMALIPVIIATGSRSGLVLTIIALAAGAVIAPRPAIRRIGGITVPSVALYAIPLALIVLAGLIGHGLALTRLMTPDNLSTEQRVTALPVIVRIIRDFFPFGTGFGTFDPAFRMYEPDAILGPNYFNHAHNDLLELVMTGGVLAAAPLFLFVVWLMSTARRGWQEGGTARATMLMAVSILILAGVASLTDYPIRTPLISAIVALASGWLSTAKTSVRKGP